MFARPSVCRQSGDRQSEYILYRGYMYVEGFFLGGGVRPSQWDIKGLGWWSVGLGWVRDQLDNSNESRNILRDTQLRWSQISCILHFSRVLNTS